MCHQNRHVGILQCWWSPYEMSDKSCTYPILSGMSRVFYLLQHRKLSTRHSLVLHPMRLTGCWVSADEVNLENSLATHQGFEPSIPSVQQARILSQDHSAAINLCECGEFLRWPSFASWPLYTGTSKIWSMLDISWFEDIHSHLSILIMNTDKLGGVQWWPKLLARLEFCHGIL